MTIEFKAPEVGPNADALTSLTRGRGPRRGNLEDLLKYWRPIMKKPGGFRRCVVTLMDKPQFGGRPQRICAWLHHELTGKWPNEGKGKKGKRSGKKRRGRSVTRRVRAAAKKSDYGISHLTESSSLRSIIRDSREFGGILVQPIDGRQNAVEMKAALFAKYSERYEMFATGEIKRVGAFGSSSGLGQAAQAAGSILLPGDLSDIRSPIRSQIYETLTPGGGSGLRTPSARRLIRGTGRGARNKFRCPPGFEKGGTFTNSEFSTCGAQILGIPTSGPGSPTAEVNRRLSALAGTAGLVDSIGDLRKNRNALDIIRAAQIPVAPKKGSATRAQTSIDLVLDRYQTEDFDPKVVRRDGVILEPVVSLQALGKLNEFDDLADGNIVARYDGGQIGKDLVPAFSAGLRSVYVSIPDAGAVKISRVGGEISDEERSGLLRSFATGISRSADLPDPSDAVRAFADSSDGRFTVEFGTITETGFAVDDNKNELLRVSTAGGKTLTVPRWVYETFLSRSAPRRAKDAPIFEIASEDADKKSASIFALSSKTIVFDSLSSEEAVVAHGAYVRDVKMKANAFVLSASLDEKALGRRIGRGGRAVGGRSTALFDPGINRYRCPPGTRYGGRITDQFGRNCGYSLPRSIVSSLVDFGQRLDNSLDRRDRRRRDRQFGAGLSPDTSKRLNEATAEIDDVVAQFNSVFEKTEGTQAGRLGRTVGEARVSTDLTPEERELLEGNSLAAALENLRDLLNEQDFENADLDAIRKAYRAVEKAANVEAGRQTDNPPRTPEQRSLAQRILDFLKEILFRMLGIWNPDADGRGGGPDVTPGARPRVPGGQRGRPRVPGGRPRIPVDDDQRRPRVPGGRVDDETRDRILNEVREMSDEELLRRRGPAPIDGNPVNGLRQMEIENEIRRRGLDDRVFDLGNDMVVPDLEDLDDPEVLAGILTEFKERAEQYRVTGGGMTVAFLESLDDSDLDRYLNAFDRAAEVLAYDPDFDDIVAARDRLRSERDRRDRVRESLGRDLRDRFDLDDPEDLARALEEFQERAEQYRVSGGGMTQPFVDSLGDEEIDFWIDALGRVENLLDGEEVPDDIIEALDRLIRERDRRIARDVDVPDDIDADLKPDPEDNDAVLREMLGRLERYKVSGGGMTANFYNDISDEDLIKFRRAVDNALEDERFGDDRDTLLEYKNGLDSEFERRFRGPDKRPRVDSENRAMEDKLDLDNDEDLKAAMVEFRRRAKDFRVTGGGMTQDFMESLSDRDLDFFERAHIRFAKMFGDDSELVDTLNETVNRIRAERERRGVDWGGESRPDNRSLINVRNRFPRGGLPDRAYWRDEDYDGNDRAELDRRFGRYYNQDNSLNDRGRYVNDRLRSESGGAGNGVPEPSAPSDDPDRLGRFDDAELLRQVVDNDLQFNPARISDDDLERLLNVIDDNDPELMRRFANADDRQQERDFPALLRIVQEENAGMNDARDANRLPNADSNAGGSTANIPEPLRDNRFSAGRRLIQRVQEIEDADDAQINNLRGAVQREFADMHAYWVNELGLGGREGDLSFSRINDYIRGIDDPDPDRQRLLDARLQDFRELNDAQIQFNRGDDTRTVLRTHVGRLSPARRNGIVGLRDDDNAVVPEAAQPVDGPDATPDNLNVPNTGSPVERLRAGMGDEFDLLTPDRLNGMDDSELDDIETKFNQVINQITGGNGLDDNNDPTYTLRRLARYISDERADRRERVKMQLDRPIDERDDAALQLRMSQLEMAIPLGRANGISPELLEKSEQELADIKREVAVRRIVDNPSADLDISAVGNLAAYRITRDSDFSQWEKYLQPGWAAAHDVQPTSNFITARKWINSSTVLSDEEKRRLNNDLDRVIRNRGTESFQRHLTMDKRSTETLQRHRDFLRERANNAGSPEMAEKYNTLANFVNVYLEERRAGEFVQEAASNRPSLPARVVRAAKYNFMRARRRREQEREQDIRDLAARRYGNSRPWDIGGSDGLASMSDATARSRVRAAFLHNQDIDVGTVTISGETYRKVITPKVRVTISRRDDGSISEIDVSGGNTFKLIDSSGNVVKEEKWDAGEGFRSGKIQRSFRFDTRGKGVVSHNYLGSDRTVMFNGEAVNFAGGGFATELNNNAILFYRNMDVDKIFVSAAFDGNVVWPRQGFRSGSPRDIVAVNRQVQSMLDNYDGYKAAKDTGVTPTLEQLAALAIIKDDVRANRLRDMLEPLNAESDVNVFINDMDKLGTLPARHDFMLALDGDDGKRNSYAFQAFRGSTLIRAQSGEDGVRAISQDEIDSLATEDDRLADPALALPNPFAGGNFSSGVWDISNILSDVGGDPRRVTDDMVDPYKADNPVPVRTPVRQSNRLLFDDAHDGVGVIPEVPVGANGISTRDDARAHLEGGGSLGDIPDALIADAILDNSSIRRADGQFRFNKIAGGHNGINAGQGNDPMTPNGMTIFEDTVTGQKFGLKYAGGRGYGYNEAANEAVGQVAAGRFGFAQGQMRWDSPFNGDRREPGNPNRGIVVEVAHNFAPEGVDVENGSMDPSSYITGNGRLKVDLDDAVRMRVLDGLIMNTDRHSSNWVEFTDPNTGAIRLVPIDMGLGMQGRGENGDYLNLDGLDPASQFSEWANDYSLGGMHSLNGINPALIRWAGLSDDNRRQVIAAFDRALDDLRAAEAQSPMSDLVDRMADESQMGLSGQPGWIKAREMFDARYGWLMDQSTTGQTLYDTLVGSVISSAQQARAQAGLNPPRFR